MFFQSVFQLNYVLDSSKSGEEVIVRDGKVFLNRSDFLTLGRPQWMESNVGVQAVVLCIGFKIIAHTLLTFFLSLLQIGNACLQLVGEAAQRHVRFYP